MCGEWIKQYGGIYKAYIGPKPHIMISSPNIIQVGLIMFQNSPSWYQNPIDWLDDVD